MNEDLKDKMGTIKALEDLSIRLAKDMSPDEKITALKLLLKNIAIVNIDYLAEHFGEDENTDKMLISELDLCNKINVCLGLDIFELDTFRDFKNNKIDELLKEGKDE